MPRIAAVGLVVLFASSVLAGCTRGPDDAGAQTIPEDTSWVPADVRWDTSGPVSRVLEPGPYDVLPVELHEFAGFDGTVVSSAVWRPDVPEGMQVPVILDVGPYYGDAVDSVGTSDRITFLESIVPHGFAYGQVSVRGTGGSGGCQGFFSLEEQQDIDAAVTYYGEQAWSNGNVGLYGISYDGTTPWIAATFGNPHLKTIVPISGLTSIYEHSFRNGTPAAYAGWIHANYWAYGWQTQSRDAQDYAENAACPEGPRGIVVSNSAVVTGSPDAPALGSDYWEERDFRQRTLENYEGSVFLVHGWQDWRVPPHMAFPFVNELEAKGLDVKMLLGQWWHAVPDTVSRADDSVRYDYAQMLLRWFQRYLLEEPGVRTGPTVETQDSLGLWRVEETWPPTDVSWSRLHVGDGRLDEDATAEADALLYGPANGVRLVARPAGQDAPVVEFRATTGPLPEELRLAGLPRFHATFTPYSTEGARVYAQLIDRSPEADETVVGHAVMDLRYHDGGNEPHRLTPGEPVLAKMEFYPLDVAVPAGHELVLRVVAGSGYAEERLDPNPTGAIDQFVESPTPLPVTLEWGDGKSVLDLPQITRDVGDGRYLGQP